MFKNLLRIPDTFDPDDRRRRQILNVLLIVLTVDGLLNLFYTVFASVCHCVDIAGIDQGNINNLIIFALLGVILFGALLIANRSSKVPSWLIAVVILIFLIIGISQTDTPQELYNGRSLIAW